MDARELEIERAWQIHDPSRAAVPAGIWRRLNTLKNEAEPTAAKVRAALANDNTLRHAVEQCCRRRGIARKRILAEVRRDFSGAEVRVAHKNILEISWLVPSPPVIVKPKAYGERQDCILACHCLAWPSPFGIRVNSAWSLECTDHAAGRFLQRAGDNADLNSALFEAATNSYGGDLTEVQPHVGMNTVVYLPAGNGCFVCTVIGAKCGNAGFLYARAATWIAASMLRPDQVPLQKAESADKSDAALLLD